VGVGGCGGADRQLQQHQEKLESLASSMTAIADAWLTGSVSGTYAVTALEQTLLLVEREPQAFATEPDALRDPRGARLSRVAERLARLLAAMMRDIGAADAQAVRQHLTDSPMPRADQE
jgi:hypothetical protein